MTISNAMLLQMTDAIVSEVDPDLVVLFGSQSTGQAQKDSDIDLLVVGERPKIGGWSRRRTVGRIRRSITSFKVPVDILFYTPEEMFRWKDATNHIIHQALVEGDVIYERP